MTRTPSGQGDLADLAAQFHHEWSGPHDPHTANPELLPVRLVRAAQRVLTVEGVGLSLFDQDFRVPLAATDHDASFAERLQFTLGEGPCLSAARRRQAVAADAEQLEARWPRYTEELFTRTPYRALMTLPFAIDDVSLGALDLYLTDPGALRAVPLADAATVTEQIAGVLLEAQAQNEDDLGDALAPGPSWLYSSTSQRRRAVWVASGVLMAKFGLSAEDAVALLRSYSYGNNATLDDTAHDILTGTLDPADLQP
jgi:hypothetical protein